MNEKATQLRTEATRAAQLSSEAVEAMKAGNFNLSRSLIKDAVEAGRICQSLIKAKENQSSKEFF